jgi:hypothetical protein
MAISVALSKACSSSRVGAVRKGRVYLTHGAGHQTRWRATDRNCQGWPVGCPLRISSGSRRIPRCHFKPLWAGQPVARLRRLGALGSEGCAACGVQQICLSSEPGNGKALGGLRGRVICWPSGPCAPREPPKGASHSGRRLACPQGLALSTRHACLSGGQAPPSGCDQASEIGVPE